MKELSMKPRNIKRREQTRLARIERSTEAVVDIDMPIEALFDKDIDDMISALICELTVATNNHIKAMKYCETHQYPLVFSLVE